MKQTNNQLSVNIYPKHDYLSMAFIDIVKSWKWKSFVIVYEANEGLMRVQEFLKEAEKNEWNIRLYQVQNRMYRDIFWEVKQNNINNVLLDLDRDNIFLALKHAQQVGMMTANQNYLITSLVSD
ncbi:hypothetical protein BLA29_007441 [Euroglyphus maynei]|uniref:Receptor ligand binding region domain-containing protein n=1 Tax=Euroglyphus maynei TaxID=6958 RepID=A0A1Y3AXS6_EURMA|nr:hypothetical protein BLA29_007441 [Euroglyphus maynei]